MQVQPNGTPLPCSGDTAWFIGSSRNGTDNRWKDNAPDLPSGHTHPNHAQKQRWLVCHSSLPPRPALQCRRCCLAALAC